MTNEHENADLWLDRDEDFEVQGPQEDVDVDDVTAEDFESLILAPSDWTVGTIYEQIGKQINLDPDFQRRNVWSLPTKAKFIESIILGVPIPQILLSSKKGTRNSYLVLDGKQRLTTISEFFSGKTATGQRFKLKKLNVLKELEGKGWADIEEDEEWADRFKNSNLRTAVLRGWENEAVLYEIFNRLNASSVKLSPMELRMSLHPGDFLKFIIRWTEDIGPIHALIRKKIPDPRMNDVELCVRFLAFSDDRFVYRGDLKALLDVVAQEYNSEFEDESFRSSIDDRLLNMNLAIGAGMKVFGDKHFCRKWLGETYEPRFNRAIFDVLVGSLANDKVRTWASENRKEFVEAFQELCTESPVFLRAIESTTKSIEATKNRFEIWYGVIAELSGVKLQIPNIANAKPD